MYTTIIEIFQNTRSFFLFFFGVVQAAPSLFWLLVLLRILLMRIFVLTVPHAGGGCDKSVKAMKKVIYTLIVVVALGAAAIWAWNYNGRAYNYEYRVTSRCDENCKDSSDCTSFYLSYPVFAEKIFPSAGLDSINASIYRRMTGSEGKTPEQLADEFFQGYRSYVAERKEIAQEEGDSTMSDFIPTWYSNAECFVVVNSPKLIVTGIKVSQFEGGAHGIYGLFYSNYDVNTGREFVLEDVFSDTLALDQKITEQFIGQKELDANIPLSQQGYFIDDNLLPLTNNFALLPDGVIFYYNVYEIAPYSDGPSYVKVPYGKLEDILKFKPDFGKAEVFSADIES